MLTAVSQTRSLRLSPSRLHISLVQGITHRADFARRSFSLMTERRAEISSEMMAREKGVELSSSPPPPKRRRTDDGLPTITLTKTEQDIRDLLLKVASQDFVKNFKSLKAKSRDGGGEQEDCLTLRITGGWVRDKILGKQSKDIDIALNRMTGFEYASFVQEYLKKHEGQPGLPVPRSIYKVERNPEKGKHLETATTKLYDLDIDFVNLRGTTYGTVPTAESSSTSVGTETHIGTATEDALRRDATVNALFYNLHTGTVEDHTGKGLSDLEAGILRTPLSPSETFHDDPLRAVRMIRFAANYGFSLAKEVEDAIATEEIRKVIREGISRERIGTEVDKMINGKNPFMAVEMIYRLGLYEAIFTIVDLPEDPKGIEPEKILKAGETLRYLLNQSSTSNSGKDIRGESSADFPLLGALLSPLLSMAWKLACVTPWHAYTLPATRKSSKLSAPARALGSGLKASNADIDTIQAAVTAHESIRTMAIRNSESETLGLGRQELGMAVRGWGSTWRASVIFSLLLEAVKALESSSLADPSSPVFSQIFPQYEKLLAKIEELNLGNAWEKKKAILDGKEMSQVLGMKPGAWMKDAVEELIGWEMENEGRSREEALQYVNEVLAAKYKK